MNNTIEYNGKEIKKIEDGRVPAYFRVDGISVFVAGGKFGTVEAAKKAIDAFNIRNAK